MADKKESTLLVSKTLKVFADHCQVFVRDSESQHEASDVWSLYSVQDRVGALDGFVVFGAARPFEVPVTVEVHTHQPESAATYDSYDHVTDVTIAFPSGKAVIIGCADDGPINESSKLEVDQEKTYVLRVLHSNLGAVAINGMDGGDGYRVVLWPASAPLEKPIVQKRYTPTNWRATVQSRIAHYMRPPHGPALFTSVALIRHGKTLPPTDSTRAADEARVLTSEGEAQCQRAGAGWYRSDVVPTATDFVVSSPATRCTETARLVLSAAGQSVRKTLAIGYLYDATAEGQCADIFDVLGYQPLSAYFKADGGQAAFTQYGEVGMDKVLDAARNEIPMPPTQAETTPRTVVVFGHAVHLPAMALVTAQALGLGSEAEETIMGYAQGEVEGLVVGVDGVRILRGE